MEMFSILIGEINAEVYILNYILKMCAFDYINYPTIKLILTSVTWRKLTPWCISQLRYSNKQRPPKLCDF